MPSHGLQRGLRRGPLGHGPRPEAALGLSHPRAPQWNSHGYDVAKVFGGKFTQISPVWLQLKRRGREMFEVTGLHDVDQGSPRVARPRPGGVSERVRESVSVSVCEYDDCPALTCTPSPSAMCT